MASILTGHVTHWAHLGCSGLAYTTACSSSCQYPATSHSHWRGVDQHFTINNLINSMRRRCVALHEANGGHTRHWLVFDKFNKQQRLIQVTAAERMRERWESADRASHKWVGIYRTWHLQALTLYAISATSHQISGHVARQAYTNHLVGRNQKCTLTY